MDINILKVKCSTVKLKGFVQDFGEHYLSTDIEILFCKLCEVKVAAERHLLCKNIVV